MISLRSSHPPSEVPLRSSYATANSPSNPIDSRLQCSWKDLFWEHTRSMPDVPSWKFLSSHYSHYLMGKKHTTDNTYIHLKTSPVVQAVYLGALTTSSTPKPAGRIIFGLEGQLRGNIADACILPNANEIRLWPKNLKSSNLSSRKNFEKTKMGCSGWVLPSWIRSENCVLLI